MQVAPLNIGVFWSFDFIGRDSDSGERGIQRGKDGKDGSARTGVRPTPRDRSNMCTAARLTS